MRPKSTVTGRFPSATEAPFGDALEGSELEGMSYFTEWVPEALQPVSSGLAGVATGFIAAIMARAVNHLLTKRRQRIETDDAFRKLDAKKHNEHLKLIGSFCNTVGAAVIGAAFIVPYIGQHVNPDQVDPRWIGAGLALPFAGHVALRFMKSES